MANVALVLGGGGVVGAGWTAGVLAALQQRTGFDPRDAALVVGTSAGAMTAAALRVGVGADELADQASTGAWTLPDPPRHGMPWMPLSPRLAVAGVWRLGEPRLGLTLAGLLPSGTVDPAIVGDRLRARSGTAVDRWPDDPIWVCAVRLDDGRRCVIGRDAHPVTDLATAVEASCAVPGYFRPVSIDGRRYVDGGGHSTTNADLVRSLGFDLVVVVSPLTGTRATVRPGPRPALRALRTRVLAREVAALRRAGSAVLVIQPAPIDVEVLDGNPLDAGRAPAAAAVGRRSAEIRLTDTRAEATVDLLRTTTRR